MSQTFDEILDAAQDHHIAGRLAEAAELYRQALEIQPSDAECHFFLGMATFQLGKAAEGAEWIRRAIGHDPTVAEYHCDLGKILLSLNDAGGSIAACRKALELRAEFPEGLFNLGNALCSGGFLEEGIEAYQCALALRGDVPDAINNLGMALMGLGRIDEALICFDRILKSNPADAAARSNRIYALHFHPDWDAPGIRRELVQWDEHHCRPFKVGIARHTNNRDADRPLRIGYVSADFREHVVGWNFLPLLQGHDQGRFHIYCYASVRSPDAMTGRLQSLVKYWRDIGGMSDEQAAGIIREDQIDILVDLSLHTGGNRLALFARKPAPIQVTYLGYPGSTGLEAMDYRFSDPFLDSEEEQAEHTERTIFLPRTFWCYRPGGPAPDVVPPPMVSTGAITFGCLNQFQKVSGATLQLWQQLMREMPGSRLLLHAPIGKHRARLIERFEKSGVAGERIRFVERLPWPRYMEMYGQIDIALDPFPFGGGITTCDALWMGIPVITFRGKTAVGRGGASILGNLSLNQWIALTSEQYLSAAKTLASDVTLLCDMRAHLRRRMLNSALMDYFRFARNIEEAFTRMWSEWTKSSNG